MAKMSKSEAGKLGGIASRKANTLRHQKAVDNYYKDPKKCPCCGAVIPYERRDNKFCSQSCSTTYNNRLRGSSKSTSKSKGTCLNCGKEFTPSRNASGKYCSLKCQSEYQYKSRIAAWKNGELSGLRGTVVATWLRKYLLEKVGHKCEKCGWDKVNPITGSSPLEIHHIDGNYLNNEESNLQVLCPNCHSLTDTYKNLNKNSGRENRRTKG